MTALTAQRCSLHAEREAAVRCPSCQSYFCRECVVEHSGRMMCARCVAAQNHPAEAIRFGWLRWTAGAVLGALVVWALFYYMGMGLAGVSSTFHHQ